MRVRFKRDVTEAATGCHPEFLLAEKGSEGDAREANDRQGPYTHLARQDGTGWFWCDEDDFQIIGEVP